jgi:two-component system chemotaxis response regulator CheB
LRTIKERGGAAVVQSPDDALYPAMPLSAIAATDVDAVVPVDQMAMTIGRLLAPTAAPIEPEGERPLEPAVGPASASRTHVAEALAAVEATPAAAVDIADAAAVDAVPARAADLHRTPTLVEQGRTLESTLSGALRALEERAALLRRLARGSSGITRRRFEQRSRQTQADANDLRDTLPAADRAPADGLDGGTGSAS